MTEHHNAPGDPNRIEPKTGGVVGAQPQDIQLTGVKHKPGKTQGQRQGTQVDQFPIDIVETREHGILNIGEFVGVDHHGQKISHAAEQAATDNADQNQGKDIASQTFKIKIEQQQREADHHGTGQDKINHRAGDPGV